MIARGKNASDLFPAVVKNVACKNIEVSATREGSPMSTSRSKLELVGSEKGDSPVPGGPIRSECPWSRKRHLPDVPEPDVDQHDGAWVLSLWTAATQGEDICQGMGTSPCGETLSSPGEEARLCVPGALR